MNVCKNKRCSKRYSPVQDKFCTHCGCKTRPLTKCTCGREFYPSDSVCGDCGTYKGTITNPERK